MKSVVAPVSLGYPEAIDPWRTAVHIGPYALGIAKLNRLSARHHNGVQVGSVVLGFSTKSHAVGLFHGANQNLQPGTNKTKACAEQVAAQKMVDHGFDQAIAVYSSGPWQPDTQSGRSFWTLHMCGECRDTFVRRPEFTDNTLVVSADPDDDVIELYRFGHLLRVHDRNTPRAADTPDHTSLTTYKTWETGTALYDRYQNGLMSEVSVSDTSPANIARLAITGYLAQAIGF